MALSDVCNFGTKSALLVCHAYYLKTERWLVPVTKPQTEVCLSAICYCLLKGKLLNIWMSYWLSPFLCFVRTQMGIVLSVTTLDFRITDGQNKVIDSCLP